MELLSHLFQVSPKSPPILIVKFQMLKQDSYWLGKPSDVPVTKDANVGHCSENMFIIWNIKYTKLITTLFRCNRNNIRCPINQNLGHSSDFQKTLLVPLVRSGENMPWTSVYVYSHCGWIVGVDGVRFFPQVSTTGCTVITKCISVGAIFILCMENIYIESNLPQKLR